MKIKIMNLKKYQPSKPYDFIIDRTTPLGNPFNMSGESNRKAVIILFKRYLKNELKEDKNKKLISYLGKIKNKLKKHGKVRLFCHCEPLPCHGSVIKKYLKGKL